MADETPATTAVETKPAKPGYKTTEFWLSFAAMAVTALYASGAIGEGGTASKIVALVATLLTALGYTVARTKAKA